jgi:hypothetical protein
MNYFQRIVLIIAIIILIISLLLIGLSIRSSKRNIAWPPLVPVCPDYWFIDGSGNNTKCINKRNLGTCKPSSGTKHLTMNFNVSPYIGANGNCAKYTWANNCGLAWDGINYGVNNPCAPTPETSAQNNNSSRLTSWVSSLTTNRQNFN